MLQSRNFWSRTGLYGPNYALTIDEEDGDDEGVVTIGRFVDNIPSGFIWQWRSRRILDGLLYGEVDSLGKFTGDNITFIYPDFTTGLQGQFVDGELVAGQAVDIVAERCQNGMKQLRFVETKPYNFTWIRDETNATYIGAHPKIIDPHEMKSVYIGNSLMLGAGEGLFARKMFLPGDMVSYFNGVKTTEEDMFHDNMTAAEVEHAGAYYFGLGENVPNSWGVPEDMMLDIPDPYRSIIEYRTTLGHKANHKV